mmetsp:Transcript_20724/g.44187  ORF Transcript_20724/g.44187 Transcript_20724/m.44187 type:complete len:835 (-) Transcript_20724:113-2617(-)
MERARRSATSPNLSAAVRAGESHFGNIVSATRLHLPADATELPEATVEHLRKYITQAKHLGVVTAIAVNAHELAVRRIAEETVPGFQINILPVPCWGAFVPALNALLTFAQRSGKKYILYQSLEVQCTVDVLQRLVDFHTNDTLVVGPVFDGHNFQAGERLLNGRTTPWNTLALWSVRKLALTGFLCIADGLTEVPPTVGKDRDPKHSVAGAINPQESELQTSELQAGEEEGDELARDVMGSDDWWTREISTNPWAVQANSKSSVPGGVEEVSAIALLQHLHGKDRARAVLVELRPDMARQLSWAASWGKDERRAKWHKYKMETKITRPVAQLQELFSQRPQTAGLQSASSMRRSLSLGCIRRKETEDELKTEEMTHGDADAEKEDNESANKPGEANFGTVMHYGEQILPPARIKWICLMAVGLFSANSTAVLASAFRYINASPANSSTSAMLYVGLLIGGVYLPTPLSLWLMRTVTRRMNHIAGLVLFGCVVFLGHVLIIVSQLIFMEPSNLTLLFARLVQGLGSGILFQVRYVLASLSTSDQHMDLQSWTFMVTDLGLGLGALLPAATSQLAGYSELSVSAPELVPSSVLALISILYLVWVLMAFPKRLPVLPDRIRFPSRPSDDPSARNRRSSTKDLPDNRRYRLVVWISGTTRVFVQSAILPVAALSMRDTKWTGNFRQTYVVAAICLLPMPFEAIVSRITCGCGLRARGGAATDSSKMVSGAVGAIALLSASAAPRNAQGEEGEFLALLIRIIELAVLMIALAMAAPFNSSRLFQLKDAERTIVILEWMKAYLGRLLGPIFAVTVYNWFGYGALLSLLCTATAVVTLTA